jgi:hypothetical protein
MSEKAIENLKLIEQDVKDIHEMYKQKESNMTQEDKDEFLSVLRIINNGVVDVLKMVKDY